MTLVPDDHPCAEIARNAETIDAAARDAFAPLRSAHVALAHPTVDSLLRSFADLVAHRDLATANRLLYAALVLSDSERRAVRGWADPGMAMPGEHNRIEAIWHGLWKLLGYTAASASPAHLVRRLLHDPDNVDAFIAACTDATGLFAIQERVLLIA